MRPIPKECVDAKTSFGTSEKLLRVSLATQVRQMETLSSRNRTIAMCKRIFDSDYGTRNLQTDNPAVIRFASCVSLPLFNESLGIVVPIESGPVGIAPAFASYVVLLAYSVDAPDV